MISGKTRFILQSILAVILGIYIYAGYEGYLILGIIAKTIDVPELAELGLAYMIWGLLGWGFGGGLVYLIFYSGEKKAV